VTASAPIRFVISDIDGTLVRDDKSLSPGNVAAIRRLKAVGIPMSLISARPPSGILPIVKQLDLAGPFGAFNGGTIFDRNGTVITAHRIEPDLARGLHALFGQMCATRWLFADREWLTSAVDQLHTPREVLAAAIEPIVTDDVGDRLDRADKLVAVSDDDALLARIEVEARRIAGGRATIARSQRYYLDVTALAANKGTGIATMAQAVGVPLDQLAVFGDQNNDLPMFARAGFSVAMGQASANVKQAASAVAASNEDDGVADAIDRFVMPRIQCTDDATGPPDRVGSCQ
jgi:Cof subfamily protein (haloacid dehalogenase superfamily)